MKTSKHHFLINPVWTVF